VINKNGDRGTRGAARYRGSARHGIERFSHLVCESDKQQLGDGVGVRRRRASKNTGVGDSPGTNPAKMGTTTPIRNVKYVRTAARAAATVAGWRARMLLLLLLLLLPLGMRKSFSLLFIHSFIFTQAAWPIKTSYR